jgi:hypothetical protein
VTNPPGIPNQPGLQAATTNTVAGATAAGAQTTQDASGKGQGQVDTTVAQDLTWRGSPPSGSSQSGQANGSANPASAGASGAQAPGFVQGDGAGAVGETSNRMVRVSPQLPFVDSRPGPKKAAPAPTIGRLLANKDYIITIECFGDVTAVYPSGQVFKMNGVNQSGSDDALVRAVTQLIARRQATVRAGDVPYRPMLRFQVHPEAMRTYFHVYPLFENLRIPMARENLDS